MPKRNRVRARARRPLQTVPERSERVERPERTEREFERAERPRRARGAPPPPGGGRAIGDASPTLERAAALERSYVVKDFGRLGKVVVAVLVLLGLSGIVVNTLVK